MRGSGRMEEEWPDQDVRGSPTVRWSGKEVCFSRKVVTRVHVLRGRMCEIRSCVEVRNRLEPIV